MHKHPAVVHQKFINAYTLYAYSTDNIHTHTCHSLLVNLCIFVSIFIHHYKMISLQQWRKTIGCFCPYCRNDFANSKCCFQGKMSFILVMAGLSLTQAQLENIHIANLRFQYAKQNVNNVNILAKKAESY